MWHRGLTKCKNILLNESGVDVAHKCNVLLLFRPQVCKAGEMVLAAGVVAAVGFGIVALAGALFGGSKKENNTK